MNTRIEPYQAFPLDGPDDFFFPTPPLLQRLDLLRHLVPYSDLVLVVAGREGSGKTTLLTKLMRTSAERWKVCTLVGSPALTREGLMLAMAEAFGLSSAEEDEEALERSLDEYQRAAKRHGLVNVVAVDDAHRLDTQVLRWLVERASRWDEPFPRLLLFGEADGLAAIGGGNASGAEFIHAVQMPALDASQSVAYIRARLQRAGLPADALSNQKAVEGIVRAAGGVPGAIHREIWEKFAPAKASKAARRAKPAQPATPEKTDGAPAARHGVRLLLAAGGAVAALVAAVLVLLWRFAPEAPAGATAPPAPAQAVVAPQPAPSPAAAVAPLSVPPAKAVAAAPVANEAAVTSAAAPPAQPVGAAAPTVGAAPATQVAAVSVPAGSAAKEARTPAQGAQAQPAATAPAAGVAGPAPAVPAASAGATAGVAAASSSGAAPGGATTVAPAAGSAVPAPAPKAAAPPPAPPATPAPKATEPAPAPAATKSPAPTVSRPARAVTAHRGTPARHQTVRHRAARRSRRTASRLRGLDWVEHQARHHYTLQVMGSFSRRGAEEAARRMHLGGDTALVRARYQGRAWFVLLHGVYPDLRAAVEALHRLPARARRWKPWPISIAQVIHKAVP